MKKLFLFFCFFCFSSMMFALKIEERYIMKPHREGQLYFILPYNIPAENKNIKDLSVDITYLTNSDSVTMNISVWSENELKTDSIVLLGQRNISINDFDTFFIEKDGRKWLHRYSLRISWENLVDLYAIQNPFILNIYSESQNIRYTYSSKAWKSEQGWMNQILYLIARNKQFYK